MRNLQRKDKSMKNMPVLLHKKKQLYKKSLMKERYQRSFFGRKDYVRILFLVKSDGILFRLSYSGEGNFF